MKDQDLFSRRILWTAGGIALFSLLFSLFSAIHVDDDNKPVAKPSALSRSALGYRALVRFLVSFDVKIQIRRYSPEASLSSDSVLLLFEPERDHQSSAVERAKGALKRGETVFLALPKWSVSPNTLQPGWVNPPILLDAFETSGLLSELFDLTPGTYLVHPGDAGSWSLPPNSPAPMIESPQLLSPGLPLDPIISADEGVLLGHTTRFGGELYLLADPDLINNHGILQGDNVLIAHQLFISRLKSKTLVFDEVIHGLQQTPSIWRELTEPPLWFLSFQLVGLLVLAIWAGLFRFGAPLPVPSRLPPGKEALVESAASLLAVQSDLWPSLQKYHQQLLFEVSSACLASSSRDVSQSIAALSRLTKQRKIEVDIEALSDEIATTQSGTPKRALIIAGLLYRWRQEMLRGTS